MAWKDQQISRMSTSFWQSGRAAFPNLKIRFINVIDLFKLQPETEHPHGMSDRDFDSVFTSDKPIICNFHAYPWLIHRLTDRRTNHENMHVRGYKEKGNINTPLDCRYGIASPQLAVHAYGSMNFTEEAHGSRGWKGGVYLRLSPSREVLIDL
jgi:phosphoketolase